MILNLDRAEIIESTTTGETEMSAGEDSERFEISDDELAALMQELEQEAQNVTAEEEDVLRLEC